MNPSHTAHKAGADPDLSDAEVDRICGGLVQNAAKVRYLLTLGLKVDRRPNGRPLVARVDWERRYTPKNDSPSTPANGPKWKTAGAAA